ncbi:hypothetical protein TWF694_008286 [Orbilia ellipsospora]|uniref:Uncharacterized protein n=1 Tax=Orbilia ellipsospora TaxID=2528407 RepID=A0AAV9XFQ0_9PEZI
MQILRNIGLLYSILAISFFGNLSTCKPITTQDITLNKRGTTIASDDKQPGGAVDQGTNNLSHGGNVCEMGLYQDLDFGNSQHSWQGYPLGPSFDSWQKYSGLCISMNDLWAPLAQVVNSYIVTGWCDCTFFSDFSCQNNIFSVYNRQDSDLPKDGPNANQIASYQCTFTNHLERFSYGEIWLSNDGDRSVYLSDGVPNDAPQQITTGIHQSDLIGTDRNGVTSCNVINTPFFLVQYKVIGVTCEVFKSNDCNGNSLLLTLGNAGYTEEDAYVYPSNQPLARIGSYRCWAPFGIKWNLLPGQDVNA